MIMSLSKTIAAGAMLVVAGMQLNARTSLFNDDWRFMLSDDSIAPAAADFNDKGWRSLSLPHDWSIEFAPAEENPSYGDGGYAPSGVCWYRNNINIKPESLGNKHQLYFEGAYMKSDVYVNGQLAGTNPYGYSSFFVDITPFVKAGNNSVAVRVDNSMQRNSRWYTGSGIYRNVWLTETDKAHIANWGVQISTPDLNTAVVKTNVINESESPRNLTVTTTIDGQKTSTDCALKPGENKVVEQTFSVPDAKAWSTASPTLYTATVDVTEDGKTIDKAEERFGFRTVEWSAEGLKINGVPTLLNGGCVHHDNGILGAAAYPAAERRRVQMLKDAGFNAMRTSHNVPSPAFLDACDELGILVIDEAFDGWRERKKEHDYPEIFDANWQRDLDAMVLRDINHPSIICWSTGNEVIERDKIEVVKTARDLVARCRMLDPTRPVTSALANWGQDWRNYDPLAEAFDIVGYNYMLHASEGDHQRDPQRIIWQTESYPRDTYYNYSMSKKHPYILGDFVWTAIDYLGEAGIGRWYYEGETPDEPWIHPQWPAHAAYCGDIDLTGLRKPISHYRSMLWNEDGEHLYMAVKEPNGYIGDIHTTMWSVWPTYESWTWPGHEGKEIDVEVYSHYPKVRLYLDDKLVGEKETDKMMATFTMPYQPGTLRAEGINNGQAAESVTLTTAGEPATLRLTADQVDDLAFIVIEVVDKNGNVAPLADNELTVTVKGNANFKALGNANIKDTDSYADTTHKAWKGRALAVAQSNGKKGNATVTVTAPGLKPQSLKLQFK